MVISGVPQGSILSPLLFIMFINDLVKTCKHIEIFLYAGDSQVLKEILNCDDHSLLKDYLDYLKLWMNTWLI
jgi:ribonuclease P/MRP protein subunit RPP40